MKYLLLFLVGCGGVVEQGEVAASSSAESSSVASSSASSTASASSSSGGATCEPYDPPGIAPVCVVLGYQDHPEGFACFVGVTVPAGDCVDTKTATDDGREVFCCKAL